MPISRPIAPAAQQVVIPTKERVAAPASASASAPAPAMRMVGWIGFFVLALAGVVLGIFRYRRQQFTPKTPPRVYPMGDNPAAFNPKALVKSLEKGTKKSPTEAPKGKERGLLD
jgi:hypothetical protein